MSLNKSKLMSFKSEKIKRKKVKVCVVTLGLVRRRKRKPLIDAETHRNIFHATDFCLAKIPPMERSSRLSADPMVAHGSLILSSILKSPLHLVQKKIYPK